MNKFAERIKDLREEKEMTRVALAQKLGLQESTVGKWERGIILPSVKVLVGIADFFGVSTDYLLGRTEY